MTSLFGSDSDDSDSELELESAQLISGLYHFSSLIPISLQNQLTTSLSISTFTSTCNQSMSFSSLPSFIDPLLSLLPILLRPKLPSRIWKMLFDDEEKGGKRQAIFNLYREGEGISSHIDLLNRYRDGIIGISLLSTTIMDFTKEGEKVSIVLNPGDVYILSGEVRNEWNHGIEAREYDEIDEVGSKRKRRLRMSITLRRMKEGGDVVGSEGDEGEVKLIRGN